MSWHVLSCSIYLSHVEHICPPVHFVWYTSFEVLVWHIVLTSKTFSCYITRLSADVLSCTCTKYDTSPSHVTRLPASDIYICTPCFAAACSKVFSYDVPGNFRADPSSTCCSGVPKVWKEKAVLKAAEFDKADWEVYDAANGILDLCLWTVRRATCEGVGRVARRL